MNGSGADELTAYPIIIGEMEYGKVYGGKSAKAIASLLNYVCKTELEKKALGQISIENARLNKSLKEAFITSVDMLVETIEKRDPYTGGHTRRVMDYSGAIGKIMDLPGESLNG